MMKNKHIVKSLLVSLGLILTPSLTSCSSFFDTNDEATAIKDIVTEVLEDGSTQVTIIFIDEEKEPIVFTIPQGSQGETGNGIKSIEQEFNEDHTLLILTITFTDEEMEPKVIEVPVINGKDGVSIKNIETTIEENGSTKVTISFDNEGMDPVDFTIPKGEKGETGNGIKEVKVVQNDDGSQTITIKYTDISMSDTVVTIPKGEKGDGIDYALSREDDEYYYLDFYFTNSQEPTSFKFSKPTQPSTWLSGISDPIEEDGRNGDFYINKSNLKIYQKDNGSWMLIAQLSESKETHTVTFDANGGTFSSDTFSTVFEINHGETFYGNDKCIFPRVTNGTKTFLGWYTSINKNDPTVGKFTDLTPVYSNMTLYAWWSE